MPGHGESPLLRLGRLVFLFVLVGVLLLASKDTKNLLQGVLFLLVGLRGGIRRLALSGGARRPVWVVLCSRLAVPTRLGVLRVFRIAPAAKDVREKRACRREDSAVTAVQFAERGGPGPRHIDFRPSC